MEAWKELTKITSEIRLSGICGSCENRMICHSCAAMAQTESGRMAGVPIYLCRMAEAMRKLALEERASVEAKPGQ